MFYKNDSGIENDFNLTIILPFYHELAAFKQTLPKNASYFQRNGIEVIILTDNTSEEQSIIDLVSQYPFVNWRVIINDKPQSSPNFTDAVNNGITLASRDYIMICSPSSYFTSDVILKLRYITEYYDRSFVVGGTKLWGFDSTDVGSFMFPYGTIMVKKEYLIGVGGYSDIFNMCGCEDDNLQVKLEIHGLTKIFVPQAVIEYLNFQKESYSARIEKKQNLLPDVYRRSFFPHNSDFDQIKASSDWRSVYDYKSNHLASQLCIDYLQSFLKYQIISPGVFTDDHQLVVLMHTYNEAAHVPEVLNHLETLCDGIIMLDDGSTDNTFERAISEKLLIKVKAKRQDFNELRNKNILLDIAAFVKANWFLIVDADERIETFGKNIRDLISDKEKAYCCYLVHLWNSETEYRTDIPEQSPIGVPGILHRWRLFKNIGHTQINSDINFHFKHTPFQTERKSILPIVIIHHGIKDSQKRRDKNAHYHNVDISENHHNYDYFLDEHASTTSIEKLDTIISQKIFSDIKN